ncbi:MAG: stage II sporulation protein E [Clostridium sp.]
MQYGLDVGTYKRVNNRKSKKNIKVKNETANVIIFCGLAFMLSRVILSVTHGIGIAPFGIAYLMGVLSRGKGKEIWSSALGVVIGYLSIYKNLDGINAYIIGAIAVSLYGYIKTKTKKKYKVEFGFIIMLLSFIASGVLIQGQPLGVNLTFSLVKVVTIIPIYYILKYALNSIGELRSNYMFSTEELISISIFICLLVAGIGNLDLFGISIRSVVALGIVITIAYVSGTGLGTSVGVTMGFIIGIAGNNAIELISLYSVCALIVGIFKDTGRLFSSVAYIIVYFIISMYSESFAVASAIEALLAALIFMSLPKSVINLAVKEVNSDKKAELISDTHLQGVKSEFISRLDGLKGVLGSLSIAINDLAENDRLSWKNKSTALVESLADRVCFNCELKGKCWEKDLHKTFTTFEDIISSCEKKELKLPEDLKKYCLKQNNLLISAQEVVSNYSVNQALKSRLGEGRKLIANHINNMSITMGDIARDFNKDITVCTDIDKILRKALSKNSLEYRDVFSYIDRKGRLKIKVSLDNCDGANYCTKKILPIINGLIKMPVSIGGDGCRINPENNVCSVIIEETPKYHVSSYVATNPKAGEKYTGDSFIFGKSEDGTYLSIISDGMGSGPEAGIESKVAVDLVETFINSGFSEITAINTVNSIMGMKFSEDEKFTTLDLNIIDLYSGDVDFIKVGGVASFIKRGDDIKVIKSESLPFGILDSVDINVVKRKLKHGDLLITLSDGVVDVDKNNQGSYLWLEEYLKDADSNPEALSRDILEKAKALSGGKVTDDMTVLVSKIYSVY